jgi:hypothetical protein
MQPTSHPLVNRPSADAGIEQLPPRDNAMLPLGQSRKDSIHIARVAFAPNSVVNATLVRCDAFLGYLAGHWAPIVGQSAARVVRAS